jgi:hypothetical protein
MRWISCALITVLLTLVPSAHGMLTSLAGAGHAYALGTVLMLALVAVLPAVWPQSIDRTPSGGTNALVAVPVAITGLAILGLVSFRLLPAVFAGPLDPNRGDMLVIIEHAVAQFLSRGNPYAIHHVPWDAPLSYGPVLWLPFVLPHVLRVDPRILTLVAQLVVPSSLILAATIRAGRGDLARAAALVGLGAALALNPDILRFHAIGHTQIYWPLLLIFSFSLAGGRWTATAICLGLLVAARTTMVALVPVFFLHLAMNRVLSPRHALWFILAAALPFLPFVVADPGSVYYAMFGVYLKVMKGFVWYSTTWTQNTYGLTGRLLERGLERYVELAQVGALAVTYLLCWRSLRRGGRPEPWMALALLVFSMTTLWPVSYLYFDVWMLLACGLLASDGFGALSGLRLASRVASIAAVCSAIVLTAAAIRPGSSYTLDIGEPSTAGYTGGGFGRDIAVDDEGRRVVWVEGETARVRVPRAGWLGATIRVVIRPNVMDAGVDAKLHNGLVQRVSAALNGRALGASTLAPGWQEITFASRGRDWRYGFNVLDLQFTYAVAARDGDGRALSAAIDRIRIE